MPVYCKPFPFCISKTNRYHTPLQPGSNENNDGIAEETQFTAGLGLNLFGARFDLGALISDADMGVALELGTAF